MTEIEQEQEIPIEDLDSGIEDEDDEDIIEFDCDIDEFEE